MIQVALHHRTSYKYENPTTFFPHVLRLRPSPHCRTAIRSYSLKVQPQKHFINWQQDPQGNYQARFVFPEKVNELVIEVDLVADLSAINPFDFFLESSAEHYPFNYDDVIASELSPFIQPLPAGEKLENWLKGYNWHGKKTVDLLTELNLAIHRQIQYVIRLEPGVQTPEETLTLGKGSCRDSAWLLVQILRNLGLAARFVSGYLIQLKPDVKPQDGPVGPDEDFVDLHAWVEVYLPGAGWIGFDPTSGLLTAEGHIPLACTPEPASAAPVTGAVEPGKVEFDFEMTVRRMSETPRVTKPYTQEQWESINQLGHFIDSTLEAEDVRLTMGGEPTFVSMDDQESAEWNTAAFGRQKSELANQLLKRLRKSFAPGSVLHFGQGKWYPGESLPRWAYCCYWRKDGAPLWKNEFLLADIYGDYGANHDTALLFVKKLTEKLSVSSDFIRPGYEDVWHYLWLENNLPANVDPLEVNWGNSEERKRLAGLLQQGLGQVVGHILPLKRQNSHWISGPWPLRKKHLFLLPGDSPMGYRLPLESLPCQPENLEPLDPTAPRQALKKSGEDPIAKASLQPPAFVSTALCVQAREGRLYVFLPPLKELEDYVDLLVTIEQAASDLNMPIILEGYNPPHDHRLRDFKVTPDPGVIEVNTQPSASWDELSYLTTTLYQEVHEVRLGAEKFMLDGRHTGTGGGNHIVLGGATPLNSPFIRRPDLLRSFVGYWNNHPSLSYLFSNLFIGPTSQAPRLDEARTDAVREIEIAFEQLDCQAHAQPWLVDRLFRNLLVDSTGNTHRAEFCIDKLYSPDSASGRLGLLELRGFEMPPHAQMSLVQQLLLRAMVAWFWKEPYCESLVRWGTQLHDRWMLPHYIESDLKDVLGDLSRGGFRFDPAWFAPHVEFRFPCYGEVNYGGVELELRQALEPWHVLGEEGSVGGTVRYVDSSLERLQVKVKGIVPSQHVITCNGRQVPLTCTGTHGEYVAGVRFRAWQPSSALHPTIPVHTPLVFDVVDTWSRHSLGGCTYHVAHPGGRNYEKRPVNALEAESRRRERFQPIGHTMGWFDVHNETPDPEFPCTLDLRRTVK